RARSPDPSDTCADRRTAASIPRLRRRSSAIDRKSTRLNSSHSQISYAVFCLKKKKLIHPFSLDLPKTQRPGQSSHSERGGTSGLATCTAGKPRLATHVRARAQTTAIVWHLIS